jgi:hypothetical protein
MTLRTVAPLEFSEQKMKFTMTFDNKHGNKGFELSNPGFSHLIFAHASGTDRELNSDSTPGGTIPISTTYGNKLPVINLTGYFPYPYPSIQFTEFLNSLAPYRLAGYNTVKNIFLVGSVLTVVSNGDGVFSELPILSKWYVKKYTWNRDITHPTRGEFNLVLLRWYKDLPVETP